MTSGLPLLQLECSNFYQHLYYIVTKNLVYGKRNVHLTTVANIEDLLMCHI